MHLNAWGVAYWLYNTRSFIAYAHVCVAIDYGEQCGEWRSERRGLEEELEHDRVRRERETHEGFVKQSDFTCSKHDIIVVKVNF